MAVGGQVHNRAAIPAGKESPLPIEYEVVDTCQIRTIWKKEKPLAPVGNRTTIPRLTSP